MELFDMSWPRMIPSNRRGERGQILVLLVISIFALILGVGLVLDGGNAFAQQRATQNGTDAAANAGAVQLLKNVAAQTLTSPPVTDAMVLGAVNAAATNNSLGAPTAFYTTIAGQCILSGGSTANPPCTTAAGAVAVGSGSIPTVNAVSGNPLCPLPYGIPATTAAPACGVAVYGSRTFRTYFIGLGSWIGASGINQLTASAAATAIAGSALTICSASDPCGFLPIAFPTTFSLCDGTNRQVTFGTGAWATRTSFTSGTEQIIPLCVTAPGSVGWLAVQPEDTGSGCNGAIPDLICDITTPDNPPLTLPVWINAQTGNTNAKNVEDAVNTHAGSTIGTYEPGSDQAVVIPLYDCVEDNVGQLMGPPPIPPGAPLCPSPAQNSVGSKTYYHIVAIASFLLDHAYINGNNPECNQSPGLPFVGGNGATGCLKGWVTQVSTPTAQIGTGFGNPTGVFGVQLIR
jgi:Flp pilus assembly protein TadG